jgi:Rrf2 family protein
MAISAVVDIALHTDDKVTASSSEVADRLLLSRRYLEPTLQALVREGILLGVRGPRGGYKLSKARHEISVQDIAKVVSAMEAAELHGAASWLLHSVVLPTLSQAEEYFQSTLKRITVEDLVRTASLDTLADYKRKLRAGQRLLGQKMPPRHGGDGRRLR